MITVDIFDYVGDEFLMVLKQLLLMCDSGGICGNLVMHCFKTLSEAFVRLSCYYMYDVYVTLPCETIPIDND